MAEQSLASLPAQTSEDMKAARLVIRKIGETVNNFKLNALPLLSLYEEWKNIQSSFAMAEASLKIRTKEVEAREKLVSDNESKFKLEEDFVSEKVEKFETLLSEIVVREDKLRKEEDIVSEKVKKCESLLSEIEVRGEKLTLEEEIVREKVKKVELREKSVKDCCEVIEMRNKEIDIRRDELGFKEKDYSDRLQVLEYNEKEVDEALEVKEREIRKLQEAVEKRKRKIEEQCRCLEVKERELIGRCQVLELREEGVRKEVGGLESKREGLVEEVRVLEEKRREMEEQFSGLERREKEVEDRGRALVSRGREVRELGEVLEVRANEIVEGNRSLEERKKKLEGREKELDERGEEMELREKRNKEHESRLELRNEELLELQRNLESKEKDVKKGYQDCFEELKLKKDQLIERYKELVSKEKEINDKRKELELKQERIDEQMKALEVKENEISSASLKVPEIKEKGIDEGMKAREGQMCHDPEETMLLQKAADGSKTIETNIVELRGNESNDCRQTVVVKTEPIDSTVKQFEEMRSPIINKFSSLFKQAKEILLKQDIEGKKVKDCGNVPRVKEESVNDTLTLRGKEVVQNHTRVDSGKKQATEKPREDNLPGKSGVSSLFTELQSVFRDTDARATASYLTEHAKKDGMWLEKMLGLRKEIPGLIKTLIAERKHLQAVMCTCVFKMKDVFPPDCLLESHLEYVRQRVKEIVNTACATAQDEAANMELNALREALQCINDFKLESTYPPALLKVRIRQLEKEMKEGTLAHLLMDDKNDHDSERKSKAVKSSPTATISPKLADHTQSDPLQEKKRKASSTTPLIQNKRSRSNSRERDIPHYGHSSHGQDSRAIPYISHVAHPRPFSVTNRPAYDFPTPDTFYGIPREFGKPGRYGVPGYYLGGVRAPSLHIRSQGPGTEPFRNSYPVNPHAYWRS